VNLAFQNIERFVPTVAMWRRTCSFFALLQGDPVAVRRLIRPQHRHLRSDHIQFGLMLIRSQDKGLNAHDFAVSYKDED
jgi:hypothetical protein